MDKNWRVQEWWLVSHDLSLCLRISSHENLSLSHRTPSQSGRHTIQHQAAKATDVRLQFAMRERSSKKIC